MSSYLAEERLGYPLLMAGVIIVASFLSTFAPIPNASLFFIYPFSLVSFPFSATAELSLGAWGYLTGYDINFFGMEIVPVSPQNVPAYGFWFFFLINLVGAMLGYWGDKKLSEGSLEWNLLDFFFRSVFWSFLICYAIVWLSWFALEQILWQGADNVWFMIVMNIALFCRLFFWIPATIATAIYGMHKWFGRRKE
ncbi:MAG: hypothetical protein JSV12_07850 [Candidatus Bathyarchaeota archaeon]|nr:MAG: hypothetical protein JSV12_07850 [Candidatus Bathyarchaeota archaeon]